MSQQDYDTLRDLCKTMNLTISKYLHTLTLLSLNKPTLQAEILKETEKLRNPEKDNKSTP